MKFSEFAHFSLRDSSTRKEKEREKLAVSFFPGKFLRVREKDGNIFLKR